MASGGDKGVVPADQVFAFLQGDKALTITRFIAGTSFSGSSQPEKHNGGTR